MSKRVIIDCFPESVRRYRPGWAIVAVDVIRATTTATTAAATGRRCFPAPTAEAAMAIADRLTDPLLAGDCNSTLPAIFEMGNSPSHLAGRADIHRPLVLVSSSGTKVIHEARDCAATYLGCFRSHTVLAGYLAQRHARVAVIGAGSKGEFREEDQICCAWIAAGLMRKGHAPGNSQTAEIVRRWRNAPPERVPVQPQRGLSAADEPGGRPGLHTRTRRRPARGFRGSGRRGENDPAGGPDVRPPADAREVRGRPHGFVAVALEWRL